MKPAPFDYVRAESVEHAVAALAAAGSDGKIIAGGQSLMPMINFRLVRPAVLVDINRISGLDRIEDRGKHLRFGALVRHRMTASDAVIARDVPVLHAAMENVAHLTVRNRGTFCGSVCHADPAAEMPMLSLLLDGVVRIAGPNGEREIAAADFLTGSLTNALDPAEMVTAIDIAKPAPGTGWGFAEFARRHGDYALAAVSVLIERADSAARNVRVAVMGVGGIASRIASAEAVLEGRELTAAVIAEAVAALRDDIEPMSDLSAQGHCSGMGARGMTDPVSITVNVNGTAHTRSVEPRLLLSDFLRHELGLTGTHVGCEHGVCGACTVLIDGRSARSCLTLAVMADGQDIETVEAQGTQEDLGRIQRAFRDHHALQCGFCTPGFLMTIADMLRHHPLENDEQIREALSGNLCRCTGYQNIVAAVRELASERGPIE